MNEYTLLKLAADSLDLLILRALLDAAMTKRVRMNSTRMSKLTIARDLLVELHLDLEPSTQPE